MKFLASLSATDQTDIKLFRRILNSSDVTNHITTFWKIAFINSSDVTNHVLPKSTLKIHQKKKKYIKTNKYLPVG